jgi:hypothetical protein
MSFYLADASGHLADVGSATGRGHFRRWARTQAPAIRRFVEHGETRDPAGLAAALQAATATADVATIKDILTAQALRADLILILSQ